MALRRWFAAGLALGLLPGPVPAMVVEAPVTAPPAFSAPPIFNQVPEFQTSPAAVEQWMPALQTLTQAIADRPADFRPGMAFLGSFAPYLNPGSPSYNPTVVLPLLAVVQGDSNLLGQVTAINGPREAKRREDPMDAASSGFISAGNDTAFRLQRGIQALNAALERIPDGPDRASAANAVHRFMADLDAIARGEKDRKLKFPVLSKAGDAVSKGFLAAQAFIEKNGIELVKAPAPRTDLADAVVSDAGAGIGRSPAELGLKPALDPQQQLELLQSPEAAEMLRRVAKASKSKLEPTVLVRGETGAGKEIVARAIHQGSARRDAPFIAINVGALPEKLIESELFGHEKGAFTGADRQKIGRFELAEGGTLFLDEIGEMPAAVQAKLLRALQDRQFTRVGGTKPIPFNVRVIAATHRDLEKEIRRGKKSRSRGEVAGFREDLFFRLNVVPIRMPALRDRKADILPIARYWWDRFGPPGKEFSPEAVEAMMAHDWPGNIRELRNAMERAALVSEGAQIQPQDILAPKPQARASARPRIRNYTQLGELWGSIEAGIMRRALDNPAVGRSIQAVAEFLGVSRRTLSAKMTEYGLRESREAEAPSVAAGPAYLADLARTKSPQMQAVVALVAKVAPSEATTLVRGETGTGKELVARAMHEGNPKRSKGPFITVNVSAIPETLIESELFGHEKGAFTGADRQKIGRFELANGGTLFLDEIAELPPAVQAKLLRALEERQFYRVGGTEAIPFNVRVVAATHQNLEREIELARAHPGQAGFREDLFYRLNTVQVFLPALRERSEDVTDLAALFWEQMRRRNLEPVLDRPFAAVFSPEAQAALRAYPWPGNIRELINVMERVATLADGPLVNVADLDLPPSDLLGQPATLAEGREALARAERDMISRALRRSAGNVGKTASQIGISRRALTDKMTELGLRREDFLPGAAD